jgi:hypothetical protein
MNMTPTLSNIRRMAERLGATVDTERGCVVVAPVGKRWEINGGHTIDVNDFDPWVWHSKEGYRWALEGMKYQEGKGWLDCADPKCDWVGCPVGNANLGYA